MENTISSFPSQVDVESHLSASAVEELDAVVTAVAEPSVFDDVAVVVQADAAVADAAVDS